MRYIYICFLLFFISANTLFAQQSIGFSDPDSLQQLLDYRLPDWGYSNFYVDFDAKGDGFDRKTDSDQQVQKSGNIGLAPVYNLYRESEQRIFRLNTRMDLSYNRQVNKSSNIPLGTDSRDSGTGFETILNFSSSIREYRTEQSFFYGQGTANLRFNRDKSEEEGNGSLITKRVSYDRTFSLSPRLGIGFGRVRNVSPVIRGIRLKERTDALNSDLKFTNGDILSAADQFSRYDGYQATYDRPAKYFWGDMDEMISANLGSVDAFDMLYLTDVFDEAIGTRLEGWEIIGGLDYTYLNSLNRDEETVGTGEQVTRNTSVNNQLGIFLNGRWYKNTSLRQQWGLVGNMAIRYPLNDNLVKRNLSIGAGINWLWNVSDRILLQASLNESYNRSKREGAVLGGSTTEFSTWSNRITLSTDLNYFIENSVVINASVTPTLLHQGDNQGEGSLNNREFNWGIRVGLRYYFSRNLY